MSAALTAQSALAAIERHADAEKAAGAKAYHKSTRPHLGVSNVILNDLTKEWRRVLSTSERCEIAAALWEMDIHETRLTAAKLLTQGRIKEDGPVWQLLCDWMPDFDAWAVADHVSMAAQKRLLADDRRIEEIENWSHSSHMWTKRAALVTTLPFAKQAAPNARENEIRERVLGWAARYVDDQEWFIQKCVAWWLRDLSKKDPERVALFLEAHHAKMKAFARREAAKYLPR